MDKFEYEGENFYFHKGQFYDETFMSVEKTLGDKLAQNYFSATDYTSLSPEKLIEYIKSVKDAGQVLPAKNACVYGLEKFAYDRGFVGAALPMLTSVLRQTGSPREAVEAGKKYLKLLGEKAASVPFYTSLAAAFCDLGDYASAKKCADCAYRMQGGGKGYANELSLVYRRLKNESGGACGGGD